MPFGFDLGFKKDKSKETIDRTEKIEEDRKTLPIVPDDWMRMYGQLADLIGFGQSFRGGTVDDMYRQGTDRTPQGNLGPPDLDNYGGTFPTGTELGNLITGGGFENIGNMQNLNMYCLTINEDHLEPIKKIGYLPVGLGNNIKSKEFIRDNTSLNISEKNPYYGEYTFYYWYWKNMLKNKKDNEWIGFCSYRELWGDKKDIKDKYSIKSLLKKLPDEWSDYETIIGKPFKLKKPNKISVKSDRGSLQLKQIDIPWMKLFKMDSYHSADYNLFWLNVRENLHYRLTNYFSQ